LETIVPSVSPRVSRLRWRRECVPLVEGEVPSTRSVKYARINRLISSKYDSI
jgi:hypothetical protein